jgi:hypothetical protein
VNGGSNDMETIRGTQNPISTPRPLVQGHTLQENRFFWKLLLGRLVSLRKSQNLVKEREENIPRQGISFSFFFVVADYELRVNSRKFSV